MSPIGAAHGGCLTAYTCDSCDRSAAGTDMRRWIMFGDESDVASLTYFLGLQHGAYLREQAR